MSKLHTYETVKRLNKTIERFFSHYYRRLEVYEDLILTQVTFTPYDDELQEFIAELQQVNLVDALVTIEDIEDSVRLVVSGFRPMIPDEIRIVEDLRKQIPDLQKQQDTLRQDNDRKMFELLKAKYGW